MKKACVLSTEVYLPPQKISNETIENRVNVHGQLLTVGILERAFGSEERRFAGEDIQVSDLAAEAARPILNRSDCPKIDLLIFAAASSDLIEPATANIIQKKLGLRCPVIDIKNACNSMTSALQVASAFIESGIYEHILLVCGEKLSEVINYQPTCQAHLLRCLPGYSLGDAGVAMLIGRGESQRIVFQKFQSFGEHWELCTVAGGGSLHFRDANKYYFEGNAGVLSTIFKENGIDFILAALEEAGWKVSDIDWVVPHQIASWIPSLIAQSLNIPKERCINTFPLFGNTAAASIPLAFHIAKTDGRIKPGQKIMLLGMAAGISVSVQLIE